MNTSATNTRRWKRHPIQLPVRILPCSRLPSIAMPGGTELGHGGMALYTGIDLEPDDLIELEFLVPDPLKVMARVRNRHGYYFGLEFLAILPGQASGLPKNPPPALPKSPVKIAGNENIADPLLIKKVFAALHRKALEIKRVQREIDALLTAAVLLAE